jgi:hypothetical protein
VEDKIGEPHYMYKKYESTYIILAREMEGKFEGRDFLEDLCIDVNAVLKLFLFRIRTSLGSCKRGNKFLHTFR